MAPRFELKYLVNHHDLARIEDIVRQHATRDPYDRLEQGYLISSTYFDTPDLLCYFEKLDGVPVRKKYRLRTYGTDPDSGFFEIKYRNNQLVDKQRIPFSASEWPLFFNTPGSLDDKNATLKKMALNVMHYQNLQPTHLVQYRRRAYIIPQEIPFRITFDFDVSGSNEQNHHLADLSRHVLFASHGILEIKIINALPLWCLDLIKKFQLVSQSISKYVLTLEKVRDY